MASSPASSRLGDSLSRAPFATTIMAEDLNDHEVGAVAFKYDTANIPSGFEYGICICLRATTSWLWQIAISTNKNAVFIRNKVNNASWSAWTSL